MKKTILSVVFSSLIAAGAFGQGYINWASANPTYLTFQYNSTPYSSLGGVLGTGGSTGGGQQALVPTTGGFYYQMLYNTTASTAAPTTLSALTAWSDQTRDSSGSPAILQATASTTSAGYAILGGSTSYQVNWAHGTTYSVMMVGWSANLGTTYAAALANMNNWATDWSTVTGNGATQAFFGVSSAGNFNPASGSPGTSPFGPSGGLINSPNTQLFELAPVSAPEPGTMALAALGGASLLLFRRRK